MNPMNVSRARTARLVADANRVVYTSESGVPTQRERERAAERERFARDVAVLWDGECRCGDC